jgi:hypothetical protein
MAEPTIYVVHEFSVRPAAQTEVESALATIVGHIRADHPEVLTCQTFKQWVGPRAHRGYVWLEGFESLSTMDSGAETPTCKEVWEPIYRLAQDGSVMRSVWIEPPAELSMRR